MNWLRHKMEVIRFTGSWNPRRVELREGQEYEISGTTGTRDLVFFQDFLIVFHLCCFFACWLHSFSLQTSWFHMAGHLAVDSSCFTFYGFHTGKDFFPLVSVQKFWIRILIGTSWPRTSGQGCEIIWQYYATVTSIYRNMKKKQNDFYNTVSITYI